jgi:hypothetical protein
VVEKVVSIGARRQLEMAGKIGTHLRPYAMGLPSRLAASGGDAAGMEMFANMRMVEFAVELGIGQDQSDGTDAVGGASTS